LVLHFKKCGGDRKMYSGMKKVCVTAIVAALVLSGLLFTVNLSINGRANNVWIQGRVLANCGPLENPVKDANVTLTSIHPQTSSTDKTGGDGTYEFNNPSPGTYIISVEKDGYFKNESTPFRFDGTDKVTMDMCLEMMPDKDLTLEGTIGTNQFSNQETPDFSSTHFSEQNVNAYFGFNPTDGKNYTDLSDTGFIPIINGSIKMWWNGTRLNESSDYIIVDPVDDLWNGVIFMTNSTVITNLNREPPVGFLSMSHNYSDTSADLQFSPIAYKSVNINKSGIDPWPADDNYTVDYETGTITLLGNFVFGVDTIIVDYKDYTPVDDATVSLYNLTYEQEVDSFAATDGRFSIDGWSGEFELRCTALGYEMYADPNFALSSSDNITIILNPSVKVWGWAVDSDGMYIKDNVRAYLYTDNTSVPLSKRLISASIIDSYFTFDAYLNDYILIVDAGWNDEVKYKANVSQVTISGEANLGKIALSESDEETYTTEISFKNDNDWNNISVYHNVTLNADSRIFGLDNDNLRYAALQIDIALGDGDGTLTGAELTNFQNWILERGPEYMTTEGFLSINSLNYISVFDGASLSETDYSATVDMGASNFWINTTTKYTTNFTEFTAGSIGSGLVELDQHSYFLNLTMEEDTSTDVDRNYSYTVHLPQVPPPGTTIYELNLSGSFISPGVDIAGYIDVELDPTKSGSQPTAELRVEKALNGTARAKVIAPDGKYHVLNSSFDNYQAIVAQSTNITFSAADSTDPNQENLEGANFTWHFKGNTPGEYLPENMGYEMEPIFNYTTEGDYTVKLNVTEAGGNITYEDINIKVDGTPPTAVITVDDMTLETVGSFKILYVNESETLKLNGTSSTDKIFGTVDGEIDEWRWLWRNVGNDTNASQLGETWEISFSSPGVYDVTLNVTDVVGHFTALPLTNITIIVEDITPPVPVFDKIENNSWLRREALTENQLYWFDASKTTDNYDEVQNLTFNWTFPGGVTKLGVNVSHTYTEVGTSNLTLMVTDTSGNTGNTTQSIVVQPNLTARPDLRVIQATFEASPGSPEEGQTVTLSVNITNKEGRADATNVMLNFTAIIDDAETQITGAVEFFDTNGAKISNTIASNQTVTVKIKWVPPRMGNFTIRIEATTDNEHSGTTLDNSIAVYINVLEAGWKRTLIYALIIGVPILIFLFIYLRRKYKRGEIFKKRDDEEEDFRGRKRKSKKSRKED
jgi:PKD repeat protein